MRWRRAFPRVSARTWCVATVPSCLGGGVLTGQGMPVCLGRASGLGARRRVGLPAPVRPEGAAYKSLRASSLGRAHRVRAPLPLTPGGRGGGGLVLPQHQAQPQAPGERPRHAPNTPALVTPQHAAPHATCPPRALACNNLRGALRPGQCCRVTQACWRPTEPHAFDVRAHCTADPGAAGPAAGHRAAAGAILRARRRHPGAGLSRRARRRVG